MKTINIITLVLAFAIAACGSTGTSDEQTVPSSQQLENLCKDVSAWCTHPWISAETQTCYCLCDWHDDCADSPTPSNCGVLLNDKGLAVSPDGDPYVCRLLNDGTKTP